MDCKPRIEALHMRKTPIAIHISTLTNQTHTHTYSFSHIHTHTYPHCNILQQNARMEETRSLHHTIVAHSCSVEQCGVVWCSVVQCGASCCIVSGRVGHSIIVCSSVL